MNDAMNLVMLLAEEVDPKKVSPGVPGFLWTFAVMLAFIVLIFSFLKHMRRLNVNVRKAELAQEQERLAAQQAAATAAATPSEEAEESTATEAPAETDADAPLAKPD